MEAGGTIMKKQRWVFLGIGIFFALVALLWLVGVRVAIPWMNLIGLFAAPIFLMLFFIMSLHRRGQKLKNAVFASLAVLCVVVLVLSLFQLSLLRFFNSFDIIEAVNKSPNGWRGMAVLDTSFLDASYNVYPLHFGLFYMHNQGKHSDAPIEQFKWKNNHTVEVYICNCNVTIDAWWSYNFLTKQWKLVGP